MYEKVKTYFSQGEYLLNFDSESLDNGIYLLKFNTSDKTIVKKILIQK